MVYLRSANIGFDSLSNNVDLISKITYSSPLKSNGLIQVTMNAGLSHGLFPYLWYQLTPLGGELVWGLRPHVAAVD
jgi:hypothetical protein